MPRRVAVWLNPEQVHLVRGVADVAALEIVASGSPSRGHSQGVAAELGGRVADDFRNMLATAEVDLVWIAAPGAFGASSSDAEILRAAHARGVKIATLEPIPASALDLVSAGWRDEENGLRPVDIIRFIPTPRLAAPFRQAEDVLETFGHIRTIAVETWSAPHEGSLGARIYGALSLLASLMGEPETIDAAYVAPNHGKAVHALPGESLRGLCGDLAATLRFADGRAASLVASDQGGRWNQTVSLIGPGGRLRIFDDGFEWIGLDGQKLDESRPPKRGRGEAPPSHAVTVIAEGISRLLDSVPAGPLDHASVLAMSQSLLLSARTGEPESPGTIRQMVGG
jgi:predicted dehydrogenase